MRYLIRTKLILLLGIPVVLTYLAVMAFDILQVRQLVEHETELHMANLVQNDLNEMAAIGNKHGGTLNKSWVTASWGFRRPGMLGHGARDRIMRTHRGRRSPSASASITARIEG